MQNFRMIDVGEKQTTRRRAVATGKITVSSRTMEMIKNRNSPKGDILAIAEVAGIMAAKNTSQCIPLCHPLLIDSTRIHFSIENQTVTAYCEVICHGKTGVEMEALFGLNTCLLTIYDLAKAVDPVIEISEIYLQKKEGGKSGLWEHPRTPSVPVEKIKVNLDLSPYTFAAITLSDRASRGEYQDLSGEILDNFFTKANAKKIFRKIIPDDAQVLKESIIEAKEKTVDILVLTGGTGISSRDITTETLKSLSDKELVGFGELQRQYGSQFTNLSWLSRSSAFVIGTMLVVLFPGSPKAVTQGLEAVGDLFSHACRMIRGEGH